MKGQGRKLPTHSYLFIDRPPPRKGTYIRWLYDMALAGKPINFYRCAVDGRVRSSMRQRDDLRDYHGFVFERESRGVWRAIGRYHANGVYERIYPSN